MKELYSIIDEQALVLKWNGYDEKSLNNGEAEGNYKEHLKLAVQELLENTTILFDKEPFQLHLFGYFRHGEDIVHFIFNYEYDAALTQISLKEIEARLNNIPLIIPVEFGSDVWNSKELYQRVKLLSDGINNSFHIERTEKVQQLIEQEIIKLKDCNYAAPYLQNLLTTAINKAEGIPNKQQHDFIVNGKLASPSHQDAMYYRLHYNYRPSNIKLQLKSVYARIANVSRTFLGTTAFPIPPAPDIHQYLTNLKNIQTSQKITTPPTIHPNNMKRL